MCYAEGGLSSGWWRVTGQTGIRECAILKGSVEIKNTDSQLMMRVGWKGADT